MANLRITQAQLEKKLQQARPAQEVENMANIDQIKKQYGKLTNRERFALIVAAADRDDMQTRDALVSSSPTHNWSVKTHFGLSQGFNFASLFFMAEQLGLFANMYFMQAGSTPGSDGKRYTHIKHDGKEFSINFDELGNKVIRRVITNFSAWLKLCAEYKINGDALLKPLPHYETMMLMTAICEAAASMIGEEAQPIEEEIQAKYDEMRAVVGHMEREWL